MFSEKTSKRPNFLSAFTFPNRSPRSSVYKPGSAYRLPPTTAEHLDMDFACCGLVSSDPTELFEFGMPESKSCASLAESLSLQYLAVLERLSARQHELDDSPNSSVEAASAPGQPQLKMTRSTIDALPMDDDFKLTIPFITISLPSSDHIVHPRPQSSALDAMFLTPHGTPPPPYSELPSIDDFVVNVASHATRGRRSRPGCRSRALMSIPARSAIRPRFGLLAPRITVAAGHPTPRENWF